MNFFFEVAPLIIWIMKGCLNIFGNEYFDLEIIFINYFFFLMALYFINKICIEIKNKETGTIAMILFALTPCIYGASRQYGHHDYHIMCISLLNIYALIKLEDFTNRKWSIIYGISVGIGLMAKDSFLAYFFVPWVYVVIRSLLEKGENKKQKTINILITILIGALIVSCYYFNIYAIIKTLKDPFTESSAFPYLSFDNIRVFTFGLGEYLLSFPIFVLFLLGMIWYVLKYNNKKYRYVFLLWFIVPWTILMLMPHRKTPDYGLGLIPVSIIIISLYISKFKTSIYKKVLSIFLVFILLLQYISFSYGINVKLFNSKINLKGYDLYYFDKHDYDSYFPNLITFNHKKRDYCLSFLRYLGKNFKKRKFFMYKYMYTSNFNMEEMSILLKITKREVAINFDDILDADIIIYNKSHNLLDDMYIIDIEKRKYIEHFDSYNDEELERSVMSIIGEIKNKYIILDEFDLDEDNITDDDHIIILGRKQIFGNNYKLKVKYKLLKF